mgnify:CR=1 FL=1
MITYTRRKLLAAAATAAVAGCVSEGQQSPTGRDQMNNTNDSDAEAPETDDNSTAEREAELDRLPDRSPLSSALANFFAASDREAYAQNSGVIEYRDGRVRVKITLEPDGEAPDEYLPEENSGYGDTVIADVLVDNLVDLGLAEDVRLVSLPSQPQTHN